MFKLTIAALLTASATTAVLAEPAERMTPGYIAGTDPSVGFPDVASSRAREGRFLSSRNIRMIARPQIYALAADGDHAAALNVSWKGKSDLATPTPDGVKEPLNRRATIMVAAR